MPRCLSLVVTTRIMNARSPDEIESAGGSRVRFELILGSIWLALGLFVVPALIYLVGSKLLGPYGENAGLSTFYGAFFADLASGAPRTWMLALGPLVLMSLVRVIFIGAGAASAAKIDSDDDPAPPRKPERPAPSPERRRVEPRVS